jgi:hypothetical protein
MMERTVPTMVHSLGNAEMTPQGAPISMPVDTGSRSRRVAWALARVLILAVGLGLACYLYFSRSADPERLTVLAIEIAGTPVARGLVWGATVLILCTIVWLTRRLGAVPGYLATMVLAAMLLAASLRASGAQLLFAVPMLLILGANLLPDAAYRALLPWLWLRCRAMAIGVGVAELLQLRRYGEWVAGREIPERRVVLRSLPGIAVVAAMLALSVKSAPLVPLEQAIRMPSFARVLMRGDFNQVTLDHDARHLFASGHGIPRLLRLELGEGRTGRMAAQVDTGGAQGFAVDEAARELYVYHGEERRLLVLDTETLALRRSLPVPDLSPGDPWIAVHPPTDTVAIVSEADETEGTHFVTIDRRTGEVRDRRDIDAGNILLHPGDDRLFMSFFRRRGMLMTYDLRRGEIVAETEAPRRVDRMAYLPSEGEVLLAVPTESRILRYDAATLALKGQIPSIFGIRSMAVDTERGLLLGASLVSGEVVVTDLRTGRTLSRFYVAPWLRTIELDPHRGIAFVSSARGLHEVQYGHFR